VGTGAGRRAPGTRDLRDLWVLGFFGFFGFFRFVGFEVLQVQVQVAGSATREPEEPRT